VAVPPPARRPIPPPARKPAPPVQKKSPVAPAPKPEPEVEEPPSRPIRKPTVRKPEPPKEVKPVEQEPEVKQEEQREEPEVRKSPEASEPIASPGGDGRIAGHRRTDTPEVKRYSSEALRAMEHEDRYRAWKRLNTDHEVFVPLLAQLPRKMQMLKAEAVLREIVSAKAPKAKNLTLYYCPYCMDWQVFHYHSWTGYNKCTGCSISSKDFYTAVDNGIFGKE
jgi:hypothetical protein